jgi:ABC-type antimicrobial peptide transport system permease subunit
VALLEHSIFQSELLISEENFLEQFPSRGGFSYFLLDTPGGSPTATAGALEAGLGDYGFDVTSTAEKLARYQAAENTFLATFQVLGGLGLLLGTLGLAVVMVRNVLERRRELAALRAFGYRRFRLGWMVAVENGFLLVVGMAVGSLAALVAVAPNLLSGHADVPWRDLGLTLAAILVAGLLAGVAAMLSALRAPLLPELKRE